MAEPSVVIRNGGCACGQVTFRASGEPDRVALCHCLTCRKASGSAFGAFAIFRAEQVTVDGRVESWASSKERERALLLPALRLVRLHTRCNGEIELGLGAFDEPRQFSPDYEAWAVRREHWLAPQGHTAYARDRSR